MKKALKITGKILLGLLILLAVFLIIMTIYNQIMLRKNKDLYETPLGQLVEVDGHNMSIYTEGEGEHTIVFMSGWGTNANNLSVIGIYPAKKSNRVFRTKHFALMRKFRARGRPSLNDRHRLFQA